VGTTADPVGPSRKRVLTSTSRPVKPAAAASATVPAAARTMALLEVFAKEKRELTKSEVARLLNLPESSSSDLLNTLSDIGYLTRSPKRRYYPTARLLATATEIAEYDALGTFGAEATGVLAERAGETAAFAVLAGARVKVIAAAQGTEPLRFVLTVGDTYTIHATAIGKAILGAMSMDEALGILKLEPLQKRTETTKTNYAEILSEVKTHQQLGWYQSIEEGTVGVSSMAVSGMAGDRLAALGIIGPSARIAQRRDYLIDVILGVEQEIFGAARSASSG
jgi:DNA-binding IclR family transcriptional regulator